VVAWSDQRVTFDPQAPANPYAPPGSDVNAGVVPAGQGVELAERGTRLWAVSIDGLLISIPMLPMLGLGVYFALRANAAMAGALDAEVGAAGAMPRGSEAMLVALVVATGLAALGALGIAIYQWVLISRTGQSLGKKWTGIRIERLDGGAMTFGTGVFLRNWVPKLIGSVPYMGGLFWLVDCLFIFRHDRRCVHDHIAGTRVVRHLR
jgi:uncharacterized RDD family membrane protein YckC